MTKLSKIISESSLSRIWKQVTKYDSGTISAFRVLDGCEEGRPFSKSENMNRHRILKAKLLKKVTVLP